MKGPAAVSALVLVCAFAVPAGGAPLSIYDIQYTTDPAGDSPEEGEVVDCDGGVVTHTSFQTKPRLYLHDPAHPGGWGSVMVKDWTGGSLVGSVSVGDWVSLTNVFVEEYRGNTVLQYDDATNSDYQVKSSDNPVPDPLPVSPGDFAAPVEGPPDFWFVNNHDAEPYEAMWLTVSDVTVTDTDLGKAQDNYNLHSAGGNCWATDYFNKDKERNYHPDISIGQQFERVTGILDQYTRDYAPYDFDYYQLMTTSSDDLVVPEPMTLVLLSAGLAGLAWRRARRCGRRPAPSRR